MVPQYEQFLLSILCFFFHFIFSVLVESDHHLHAFLPTVGLELMAETTKKVSSNKIRTIDRVEKAPSGSFASKDPSVALSSGLRDHRVQVKIILTHAMELEDFWRRFPFRINWNI